MRFVIEAEYDELEPAALAFAQSAAVGGGWAAEALLRYVRDRADLRNDDLFWLIAQANQEAERKYAADPCGPGPLSFYLDTEFEDGGAFLAYWLSCNGTKIQLHHWYGVPEVMLRVIWGQQGWSLEYLRASVSRRWGAREGVCYVEFPGLTRLRLGKFSPEAVELAWLASRYDPDGPQEESLLRAARCGEVPALLALCDWQEERVTGA